MLAEGRMVREVEIDPAELGLRRASRSAFAGGDAARERAIAHERARRRAGAARDVVILNAGAALFVAGRATDVGGGRARSPRTRSTRAPRRSVVDASTRHVDAVRA